MYANNVFSLCIMLSVGSSISMYNDLSLATMTGAPFYEMVVSLTSEKYLSKFNVPPVAIKISFHSCT